MEEVYIFPVSYAQRRLWFLDRLEPGSPLYNVFDVIPLYGALDAAALARALDEVVGRHEVLRTTFGVVDGEPVQVVAASLRLAVQFADLRHLPESERGAAAARLTSEEYERPFDLERGPLLRATLMRLGEEESALLVVTHHVISDGWSLGIFRRELLELYRAHAAGEPPALAELPVQYADYALWQREWLQGGALEEQLAYWRAQLAGGLEALELPGDHPRPPVQTYRGASQSMRLPAGLAEELRALSRREGVTLFMTLLAAFFTLLGRYTGRADLLVGTPVAGRGHSELEGLIGFFVNTLVIRADLGDDPTFVALLRRVQEACLGAYAHQDVPFELLVEELRPERDPGHNPVFQVMFQLITSDTMPDDSAAVAEAESAEDDDETEIKLGTAKFDLSLDLVERNDGGLDAAFEYSTDLFEHDTVRRMLRHLKTLLEGIAADPARRLSSLPLLTEAERRRQLSEWNSTARDYPEGGCIHELFEAQAARTPDAVAVVSEGGRLSYRELNGRANKLARHLRRLGVGPETRVGVCLEGSASAIVGLLGVLKAGGAYVPLDPAYPKERLSFMLEEVGAPALVTERRLLDLMPAGVPRVVCMERDWEQIELEDDENPPRETRPENLAYVIYTSGSTGRPKGVMVEHRSLVNFTLAAAEVYGLRASDRMLQFSSISFDAAAEEIYPCLTLGATLVLRPAEALYSAETMLEKCRELGVTVLDLPTAYWHELTWELSARDLRLPACVRMVIVGGEKMLPERLSMWQRGVGPGVRLMNGYGPTETTVVATVSELTARGRDEGPLSRVPIGRPMPNVQAYILDENLSPVPVGVAGELYVGGAGVARGYLGAPDLTAARFVPDPFGRAAGARLYRTGDVARYTPAGEVEFVGRADGQVKVRGFRVELGEVEAALRTVEGVREAAVVAREETSGQRGLAAYVAQGPTNGSGALTASSLRAALKGLLPGWMVPAWFVILDALPLTPSGKIDRKALPPPNQHQAGAAAEEDAPRTETERTIAAVWREVLGVEPSSVHSNFFDLGGHSLALVRVNGKLRDLFGREIPMVDMFKYPTISALADSLGRGTGGQSSYQEARDRAARRKEALSRRGRAAEDPEAVAK